MSFVRLMTGDVSPEQLGFTYSHEHIICRPGHWIERGDMDLVLDDEKKGEEEVLEAKKCGVDTIVDATAIDYGRDPQAVYNISMRTGMQIIGTAGFNKGFLWDAKMPERDYTYQEWIEKSSEQELTDFVVKEVTVGMQGTSVKGGQVKFGTGYNSISPLEVKTIRAVCRAHLETGAPIHSHTEAGTMALEQMRYLREEGVDLHHVSFGHMDRNPDSYMHLKIADTGAFLCFDGIAKVKYNPESTRIQCILELVKHGYQKQILVSGDTARRSYYRSYSHAVGLPYIKETWVPRLIEEAENRGLNGEQLVKNIFIDNPRECFSFKKVK